MKATDDEAEKQKGQSSFKQLFTEQLNLTYFCHCNFSNRRNILLISSNF